MVHFNRLKPAPVGPESMDNEDGQSQQHTCMSTEMPQASSKRTHKLNDYTLIMNVVIEAHDQLQGSMITCSSSCCEASNMCLVMHELPFFDFRMHNAGRFPLDVSE